MLSEKNRNKDWLGDPPASGRQNSGHYPVGPISLVLHNDVLYNQSATHWRWDPSGSGRLGTVGWYFTEY